MLFWSSTEMIHTKFTIPRSLPAFRGRIELFRLCMPSGGGLNLCVLFEKLRHVLAEGYGNSTAMGFYSSELYLVRGFAGRNIGASSHNSSTIIASSWARLLFRLKFTDLRG